MNDQKSFFRILGFVSSITVYQHPGSSMCLARMSSPITPVTSATEMGSDPLDCFGSASGMEGVPSTFQQYPQFRSEFHHPTDATWLSRVTLGPSQSRSNQNQSLSKLLLSASFASGTVYNWKKYPIRYTTIHSGRLPDLLGEAGCLCTGPCLDGPVVTKER